MRGGRGSEKEEKKRSKGWGVRGDSSKKKRSKGWGVRGDSRDLEHNVLPVQFLPLHARTAHRLFSPSESHGLGRVLRYACEGRGGAVGEEGHNDEGVKQAPDDGPVPLVALDRPPLVPVNGHAVAARRDAAAHRSRRSRPRQWRPGGRERKCDAAPPVLELVEEEARQRGLGRGAV